MKSWESAFVQLKIFPEGFFVLMRCAADTLLFGLHAMHIALGNRNSNEEFAARHSVVALGIRGRDRALIAPEDMHLGPIHLAAKFIGGQKFEHRARRVAARERDHELGVL